MMMMMTVIFCVVNWFYVVQSYKEFLIPTMLLEIYLQKKRVVSKSFSIFAHQNEH